MMAVRKIEEHGNNNMLNDEALSYLRIKHNKLEYELGTRDK